MERISNTARALGLLCILVLSAAAVPDEAAAQSATLRKTTAGYFAGQVAEFANGRLTVLTQEGEVLKAVVSSRTKIALLRPAELADIEEGSFIASAGREVDDGTVEALEVRIVDARLRGVGEGYRPFYGAGEDDAMMTNAKVVSVTTTGAPAKILVRVRGRDKNIILPDDAPIMFQTVGDVSALVPGASVSILTVRSRATGKADAVRISIGLDGVQPPF